MLSGTIVAQLMLTISLDYGKWHAHCIQYYVAHLRTGGGYVKSAATCRPLSLCQVHCANDYVLYHVVLVI